MEGDRKPNCHLLFKHYFYASLFQNKTAAVKFGDANAKDYRIGRNLRDDLLRKCQSKYFVENCCETCKSNEKKYISNAILVPFIQFFLFNFLFTFFFEREIVCFFFFQKRLFKKKFFLELKHAFLFSIIRILVERYLSYYFLLLSNLFLYLFISFYYFFFSNKI